MIPAVKEREKGASQSEEIDTKPLPSGSPQSEWGDPPSAVRELLICFTSSLQAEIEGYPEQGLDYSVYTGNPTGKAARSRRERRQASKPLKESSERKVQLLPPR